jgi:4-diphosphocytidyl-2-C-methyl-D-erythritol kinase
LNGLALDDRRIIEAAQLTGADVPVCVGSRACVMTGVGENLQPLKLPKMPSVMVNPCVPVATKDVFSALGLRNGELLVGATDILLQDRAWPEADASLAEWIEAFVDVGNDLEAPALRIQPVIGEVLSALRDARGTKLARMSGSGATCFAIFGSDTDAEAAAEQIRGAHPLWWVHAGALS